MAPYNSKTFHIVSIKEMTPSSSLFVWHVDPSGALIVQTLKFPVFSNKEYNISVRSNLYLFSGILTDATMV